jgi:subtilisin family serine protease
MENIYTNYTDYRSQLNFRNENNVNVDIQKPTSVNTKERYIIKFKFNATNSEIEKIHNLIPSLNGTIRHKMSHVFKGLSVDFAERFSGDYFNNFHWIDSIHRTGYHHPHQVQKTDSWLWGLDRMDGLLDEKYVFGGTGKGVNIYVIDSGVDGNHPEFDDRVIQEFKVGARQTEQSDCSGHGTHVAGIIAGINTGLAKEAMIYSMKILECGKVASDDDIISAMEWIVEHHQKPAIVNWSMGPSENSLSSIQGSPLADAIAAIIANNIHFVASAGNDGIDGCVNTPITLPNVISVGASTKQDERWSKSNYGRCVKFYAPGENIVSARPGNGYVAMSGTSMAAPFVTGLVALNLEKNPSLTPGEMIRLLNQNKFLSENQNSLTIPSAPDVPKVGDPSYSRNFLRLSVVGTVAPDGYIQVFKWNVPSLYFSIGCISVASVCFLLALYFTISVVRRSLREKYEKIEKAKTSKFQY